MNVYQKGKRLVLGTLLFLCALAVVMYGLQAFFG